MRAIFQLMSFALFQCFIFVSTRELPEKLIIAYPNWSKCDSEVKQAVYNGVNVVQWSFGNLVKGADDGPVIDIGPNLTCVKNVVDELESEHYQHVIHMLSFGLPSMFSIMSSTVSFS